MTPFLTDEELKHPASAALILQAVEKALIALADGSGKVNAVVTGRGPSEGSSYSIKSGESTQPQVIGAKLGTYWPQNPKSGMPAHGSTIILLDPGTGRVRALVEASNLNGPRTAAADAVAARALARAGASTLSVIGAGHQAYWESRYLCKTLAIRRVLVTSRTANRASALADSLAAELDLEARATDLETACRSADVLVTVTSSRSPLFDDSWIRPGTHIASMGSDQVGKQELPVSLLRRATLFCDLPSQSVQIGEYQHVRTEIESGSLSLTAIGSVLSDSARGREQNEDITIFDSSGVALQDLLVADALLRARQPEL